MEGPYAGQIFELNRPIVTIGREPGRDLSLTSDGTVSRRHAHIAMENGQHIVYDDGSSNGTFVNGVRVTIQTLAPGDMVAFGASKFRYE
jgi:pSer/pThr/pTyr-binding forkhead associated (FHA) protein